MAVQVLNVVVATLALFASRVGALSTGTGSCAAGTTAVLGGHAAATTTGPLADQGVTFTVGATVLTAGGTTNVAVGTDLQWSVDAAQSAMKGIFVRVEMASDDFTHTGDATVKASALCDAFPGVIGLDHVAGQVTKTTVTGTTNFASAGTATVDVTALFGLTAWAHSSFTLNVEAATVPVDTPVQAPVDTPVDAPVAEPVDTPVEAPVPTPVTVDAPVADVPTADGECPEGKGNGKKGEGKEKGKGGDDTSEGKGKEKKGKKEKKCKKTPKEPKTPKAGKGGEVKGGKGDEGESGKGKGGDESVRRRK